MTALFIVGIVLALGSLVAGMVTAWNGWDSGAVMLTLLLLFLAGLAIVIGAAIVGEQREEAACLKRGGAWIVVGQRPGYWTSTVVGKSVVPTYHPPSDRYGCRDSR